MTTTRTKRPARTCVNCQNRESLCFPNVLFAIVLLNSQVPAFQHGTPLRAYPLETVDDTEDELAETLWCNLLFILFGFTQDANLGRASASSLGPLGVFYAPPYAASRLLSG